MSILTSILRRDQKKTRVATGTPEQYSDPESPSSPPFVLLLPDASGIASYRFFSFSSTLAAEHFVEFDLGGKITHDTVSFWAMPGAAAADSESVVLIRGASPDSVHAFAFTDMANAVNFVRHEMSVGLTLDRVMIYWAESARIDINKDGHAFVTPSQAPAPQRAAAAVPSPIRPVSDAHREATAQAATMAEEPKTPAQVIDFPSAAKRLRASGDTAQWWTNIIEAMDEALDAYVAKQVRGRMAWRRLSRELAAAARAKESPPVAPVVQEYADEPPCEDETPYEGDTGDDSWFIPRREWGARPDEPFRGFGSPPGRF